VGKRVCAIGSGCEAPSLSSADYMICWRAAQLVPAIVYLTKINNTSKLNGRPRPAQGIRPSVMKAAESLAGAMILAQGLVEVFLLRGGTPLTAV